MATSTRGRNTSRNYSFFGSSLGGSSAGSWGGNNTGATKRSKNKRTSNVAKGGTSGYKNVCNTFQNKISSYRTLMDQTKGTAGKFPRPTPAVLNSFANWINKGAIVQVVSPTQVARWAKSTKYNFNAQSASPTSCKNVLCAKYGKTTIKAVCRSKTGKFIVATAPTLKGRAFCFPR